MDFLRIQVGKVLREFRFFDEKREFIKLICDLQFTWLIRHKEMLAEMTLFRRKSSLTHRLIARSKVAGGKF